MASSAMWMQHPAPATDTRWFAELQARSARVARLPQPESRPDGPASEACRLVGSSGTMQQVRERLARFAGSSANVLICGESGTGKELAARSLHEMSDRARGPFVAVNCAAIPETLMESELFGHEKGAFSGALGKKPGRFQMAHGGTLFLDEVAEMSPAAQAKLLRVLEHGRVDPVGSTRTETVDVRVVAATHQHLPDRIARGLFRQDLYYRLKVLELHMPPLREHIEDLHELIGAYLHRLGVAGTRVGEGAWLALLRHSFPGNVRELEHAIQQAVVLASPGAVDVEHLPPEIGGGQSVATETGAVTLQQALAAFERQYLVCALRANSGRKTVTAERLGISRKGLWEKLKNHHVAPHEYRKR